MSWPVAFVVVAIVVALLSAFCFFLWLVATK